MVKVTEEEYKQLLKNQENATPAKRKPRVYRDRGCATCGTQFTPKGSASDYCCDECKATANTAAQRAKWRKANPKKVRGTLPPLDDGKGTLTQCPDCRGTYATPEGDGSVKMERRNVIKGTGGAPGTSTTNVGGVAFDTFRCVCGHKWDRYK